MTTYALVRGGVVLGRIVDTNEPKSAFPDIEQYLVECGPEVQDGDAYDGVQFIAKPDPHSPAEVAKRHDVIAQQLDKTDDVLRAFMLAVLDEFNGHADKINAILNAVDAASSLTDLKTRVGAITDYPTRTAAQLRNGIRNKLGA